MRAETSPGGGRPARAVPLLAGLLLALAPLCTQAGWEKVLRQVDLPHHYYYREMYLPQVTAGPASPAWSPDGTQVVYSMQGSLWRQGIDADTAEQITAGPGYDFQPDWSPDGTRIVFTRQQDDALELQVLELSTNAVTALTSGGDVNVEPRWSPDGTRLAWVSTAGTGHFHVLVGEVSAGGVQGRMLKPERRSRTSRYYYSEFDHELSPTWSPDGSELLFVSNPEIAWGSGGIWRARIDGGGFNMKPVRIEETTWKARPDWSPDGRRVVYASYHGRQWHQPWLTTPEGGDPLPLGYGDFDVTSPRWSPDGARIVFVSNASGDTHMELMELPGGKRRVLEAKKLKYLRPMGTLVIRTRDATGKAVPARLAVRSAVDGRSHGPDDAWLHGVDGYDRAQEDEETRYFHGDGEVRVMVPAGEVSIRGWRGLEHQVARQTTVIAAAAETVVDLVLQPLDLPVGWNEQWHGADLHVHMNYGGTYRNTPERLRRQALAEDLDLLFNLVVNKEQRIPDIGHFSPRPDPVSDDRFVLLHAQEFHTSLWGHLGLLGLRDHFLLPDFSAYGGTAAASPYPSNGVVSELARAQQGLVGYVHPFDEFPDPATPLSNSLPVDAALGGVDYYEVVGFSDHLASAEVWHRLLNCGMRIPAGAGTDAMANFASLRGPVGMNRVYAWLDSRPRDPAAFRDRWLESVKAGMTLATNGPLLGFRVEKAGPGIALQSGTDRLHYTGWMRSMVGVDTLEIIVNGKVAHSIDLAGDHRSADFSGELQLDDSSWVLLRAWSRKPSPDVFDIYPYATTGPVWVTVRNGEFGGQCDVDYFLAWIDRIREVAEGHDGYNDDREKERIMGDIERAAARFRALSR